MYLVLTVDLLTVLDLSSARVLGFYCQFAKALFLRVYGQCIHMTELGLKDVANLQLWIIFSFILIG